MFELKAFNSVDELLRFQKAARAASDAMVEDWQRQIKPGDYFVTYNPDWKLMIYYEVLAEEPGEPPILETSRMVRGYSEWEPGGEMGFAHIASAIGLLTKEQFEKARELGWPSTAKGFTPVVAGDPAWKVILDDSRG